MSEANRILKQFVAVSVVPGAQDCCQAVEEIAGVRFLSQEAPLFPLNDCDRLGSCKCTYKHWDDRRQEDRRDFDNGIANQFFHDGEKRKLRHGRRIAD
jgi:hypothetical protein